MDDFSKLFARQTFHLLWRTSTGMAFQDLFANVMENAWPQDFQRVRSYGPRGDLKCDGYWESRQCVFQCYGPTIMREDTVIAKIKKDLEGAVQYWSDRMREWAFVHNDNRGLTAAVVRVMGDLRAENPELTINEWAWPQAKKQFERLDDEAIVEICGHPPTVTVLDQLEFSELLPVLETVESGEADPLISLSNMPSVTKLEKNSLGDDEAALLRLGRRRVRLVEEYFSQHHDPSLGDKLAHTFHDQYRILQNAGYEPNEVLLGLQRFAGWGKGTSSRHDVAVLAVLVYFFDRCDIFEDPPSAAAEVVQ